MGDFFMFFRVFRLVLSCADPLLLSVFSFSAHARARACLARSHWPLCEKTRARKGVRSRGATNGEEIELVWERRCAGVVYLLTCTDTNTNYRQTVDRHSDL